jgi:phosphate-selective porin OprO/OprP
MKTKTSLIGGAALACVLAVGLSSTASAQDTTVKWSGAPRMTNDDATFKVRGRILLDAVFQNVDRAGTGTDFDTRAIRGRQVFLGVEGQINQFFAYKAEGGAVNGGAWAWDDVVIEWKVAETTSLMFGNIKAAGLENLTSTRFTTFMDRGPYGDFGPDSYVLSAVVKTNGPNWTATGAIQGDSLNNPDVTASATKLPDVKERMGVTGRFTYSPILTDFDKVHLGVYARYRDHGNEGAFNYQSRPNTNFGNRYINSGNVGDKDTTWGVEGAWVHGPFSVQAEYSDIKVERLTTGAGSTLGGDPDLKVGYAFVSWWPTGESRNYDATKGEFGRPKILNPVNAGGFGGVELALRYDYADLTEAFSSATGPTPALGVNPSASQSASNLAGKYTAVTLGVNYYPIPYVRFQANYTMGKIDNPEIGSTATPLVFTTTDAKVNTFQLRAQLDF